MRATLLEDPFFRARDPEAPLSLKPLIQGSLRGKLDAWIPSWSNGQQGRGIYTPGIGLRGQALRRGGAGHPSAGSWVPLGNGTGHLGPRGASSGCPRGGWGLQGSGESPQTRTRLGLSLARALAPVPTAIYRSELSKRVNPGAQV